MTSVRECGPYCTHHHQVMIHRLDWTVTLNPDGTKVFRSHRPPASTG